MFQAFLDRHEGEGRLQAAGQRKQAQKTWAELGQSPEQRLLKFDVWVYAQLDSRLVWPENAARKAKLLGQCRAELEKLVLELWRRGWMLDGNRLASHIVAVLDQIGARQREGKVKDFWPFFRHVVITYVGANAEEIQAEARRIPTVGSVLATMGVARKVAAVPSSIPQLIALRREDTLREKLAKARKAKVATPTDQLSLL